MKLRCLLAVAAVAASTAATASSRRPDLSYASPTWSPDGREVVFASASGPAGQILVARGRAIRRIVRAPIISQVALSPDGRRIAFVSNGRVFVVRRDGRALRRVGPGADVVWAPDSSRLAYDSGSFGPIRVAAADRGSGRAVSNGRFDRSPSWSPDGTRLVFSRATRAGGEETLVVVGADGANTRLLGIQGADASWSPDGQRLAFWRRSEEGVILTVAGLDGSAAVSITRVIAAYSRAASWSPNGRRLALVACSELGFCRVDVGDADGLNVVTIGAGAEPSWAPDGSRIAFSARRNCRGSSIFTVRAEGDGLARLTPCR